ncbi:IPT/TIG domain-containing protein, partial [Patescibacteria group bacterium]|nr:IPT/TIG domain-containing protein [Patescibacteria group bacterium]
LFFFKAIIPALGLTLFFIFWALLIEIVWQYRQSAFLLILTKLLIAAIFALFVYALIYLPLEFLMTEIWLITPKIPSIVSPILLIILAGGFSLINWNDKLKVKSWRLFLLVFIIISGSVYLGYRQNKLAREYLPKIYNISPSWGIQAQLIEIRGVNFFPIWKKGKILFNGQEMIIKSWNEELIIAEQPVPAEFGKTALFIVRSDGIISNKVPFEVRDPSTLK